MSDDSYPVPLDELSFTMIRASGPGGQNVNKVSSAIQMRFSVAKTLALGMDTKERLMRLASHLLTNDLEIIITAERFRTQERNRQDAMDRLAALIEKAKIRPKKRIATRPTKASKERRLDGKARRSGIKAMRQGKPRFD